MSLAEGTIDSEHELQSLLGPTPMFSRRLLADTIRALWREATVLREERDQARYEARILAHAYANDARPPRSVSDRAIHYVGRNRP